MGLVYDLLFALGFIVVGVVWISVTDYILCYILGIKK
jgi:hypothetical protein